MLALALSLVAIAAAPLLDQLTRRSVRGAAFVDGLVQTVVGGILLVHVVPFGLATAGWPALFALVAGAMVAVVAHRIPGGERSAGAVAVFALLLHSGIDGAALAAPGEHADHAGEGLLGWAVVLHTVPVGLATWRISRRSGGTVFAAALLAATALATVAGWWATGRVLHGTSPAALGLAQCAAAGALLHVLGHVGDGHRAGTAPGWGALSGVAIVIALVAAHPIPHDNIDELGAATTFVALLFEAAPALLGGYFLISVFRAVAPTPPTGWLGPAGRVATAARGALLGLPAPVCSCGALPVYRGLLARGVAPAAALAFLVAGPEIGVGTFLVSMPLLGGELTLLRLLAAFTVAVSVGWLVAPSLGVATEPRPPVPIAGNRVVQGLRFGFIETVDHTAPWVLAGIGIAALAEPLLGPGVLAALPAGLGVVLAALIGVPAYVCAAGATPLVAALLHKGLSAGAAVTFLVTGPAVNVAAFGVLQRLHGRRVAFLVGLVVTVVAVVFGLALDVYALPVIPDLHAAARQPHGPIEWGSAVALAALFAASLVRNGAGGFLEPLWHPHTHGEESDIPAEAHSHSHSHSHSHAHDHGRTSMK